MIAIRFHGRGGQGGVIASKLLATALFREGWQVQAFSSFGAERAGAPVAAFVRADHQRITVHCHIYEPDHVVVLDSALLGTQDITAGLKRSGWILVNSTSAPEDLHLPRTFSVATCDATGIALRHGLGTRTSPIVNTAMVGAFVSLTGIVGLESVVAEIPGVVPIGIETNEAVTRDAFAHVQRLPADTAIDTGKPVRA